LDAYPESGRLLDLKALDLRRFQPGALIWDGGRLRRMMDVFRRPASAISTALQPIGSLRDKLLIAKLRAHCLRGVAAPEDSTTADFLQDFGFSPDFIDRFFRPFYGGIFLER